MLLSFKMSYKSHTVIHGTCKISYLEVVDIKISSSKNDILNFWGFILQLQLCFAEAHWRWFVPVASQHPISRHRPWGRILDLTASWDPLRPASTADYDWGRRSMQTTWHHCPMPVQIVSTTCHLWVVKVVRPGATSPLVNHWGPGRKHCSVANLRSGLTSPKKNKHNLTMT